MCQKGLLVVLIAIANIIENVDEVVLSEIALIF